MRVVPLIFCLMFIVPLLAEEVEYELNDDNKYERKEFKITDKQKVAIQKRVAKKIAMREIAKKKQFEKKIGKIQRKIKKARVGIEGIKKRLVEYKRMKRSV